MSLKRQSIEGFSTSPTPVLTATSTGHQDWLHEATARFRSAITLQIPIGFQDRDGFHSGLPQLLKAEHQRRTQTF
jgi:hypothetical protein